MSTSGTQAHTSLVRPFILTGGRTAAALRWEALVEAVPQATGQAWASEQQALLALSDNPISIAELSAHLHLPTQVVAVIVSDLLDAGAVRVHQTDPVEIQLSALTRMIERVRSL